MKKILSILVAMLLVISIPASAAPKKAEKHKSKPIANKQVKINIAADSKTLSVGKPITLTATNNKVGLNVYEQDVLAQTWVVQLNGVTINTTTTLNITKKASKNSPTSILKFTPTSEGKYTFIYSIRMGAGKSKVTFYGTRSLTMETKKSTPTEVSEFEFKVGAMPSFIKPLHLVSIPVTLKAADKNNSEYDNVRIDVDYAGPEGGVLNLWGKDTYGNEYDVAKIGYWGPQTGFPIDKDYNATTNFIAKFSKEGTYLIKLSLVDLNDHNSIITSKTIKVAVGSSAGDVESTYIFKTGTLPANIKAMNDISLPVALMASQVNALGYDNVKTNVDYTAPENGVLNLWTKVKDEYGNEYNWDAAKMGYWGVGTGFPISKNYSKTTNFTARFSISGTYTITFTLVNLDDDSIIASKTIKINVGTSTGNIKSLAIAKLAISPSSSSNSLYTLSVVDILATYENGSTLVTMNPVYVIGDVSFDDLVKTTYSKTFTVTYNGFTKSFTLTGKQILNLL